MQNLEGYGGPMSQTWIDNQSALQVRILERMRRYGMKCIAQGFYGMLPNSFNEKYPEIKGIKGEWCSFTRPLFLDPRDGMFPSLAAAYYEELELLYGRHKYLGGDPFHEIKFCGGEIEEGVDIGRCGEVIYNCMKGYNSESIWVLQAWGPTQPENEVLDRIPPGECLILDLWAETHPQWGKSSKWLREGGFKEHSWVWCMLHNFGGNTGMIGGLQAMIDDISQVCNQKGLVGIGATMEGINTNPVVYDLLFHLPWTSLTPVTPLTPVTLKSWLNGYCMYRYSILEKNVEEIWEILGSTCYNMKAPLRHKELSLIGRRPHDKRNTNWVQENINKYYNILDMSKAWGLWVSLAPSLLLPTFQYDLIDYTRQQLSNLFNLLFINLEEEEERALKNAERGYEIYEKLGKEMISLLEDLDTLLGCKREFRLDNWLGEAFRAGKSTGESDLCIRNGKLLLSLWGGDYVLHDYAFREWHGIIKELYLPRWQIYIQNNLARLKGLKTKFINYAAIEKKWAFKKEEGDFQLNHHVDQPHLIAQHAINAYKKYYNLFLQLGAKV